MWGASVRPMKGIVVYRSKTGFVKKYAEWIARELSIEALSGEKIETGDLVGYDTIIFGGGLYAGGINGIKLIKKAIESYPDKRIIIYISGASPGHKSEIDEVWKNNFSKEEMANLGLFYLRGGFDFNRLGIKDKMLMTLLKKKLESKKELTEDEEGMLAAYGKPVDFTDKSSIEPLIEYARD